MTNLFFKTKGLTMVAFMGYTAVEVDKVFFYIENTNKVIEMPLFRMVGLTIKLSGEYEKLVKRKVVNTSRNEVFFIGKPGKKVHLYIPSKACGLEQLNDENFYFEDYTHTYNVYSFYGVDLATYDYDRTIGATDLVTTLGISRCKFYQHKKMTPTESAAKRMKLAKDIQDACGVVVHDFMLKSILEHYRIVKRRK